MSNQHKIILDLCGGTGAWSQPYAEAGYDVHLVTMPSQDVRLFEYPTERIHGILAAPPCTYFSRMRMCRGRPTNEQLREGLTVVDACLRIIFMSKPKWWVLENPQGYLRKYLGQPQWKFDPCDYGDAWTKRTWLWGNFTPPFMHVVDNVTKSWIHRHAKTGMLKQPGIAKNSVEASQTAPGFARAFFEANP